VPPLVFLCLPYFSFDPLAIHNTYHNSWWVGAGILIPNLSVDTYLGRWAGWEVVHRTDCTTDVTVGNGHILMAETCVAFIHDCDCCLPGMPCLIPWPMRPVCVINVNKEANFIPGCVRAGLSSSRFTLRQTEKRGAFPGFFFC
jgi:hypothetical protein